MIVAIDGPAGAGKSTVARAVARRMGVAYLDTGAMYRALTWLAGQRGIAPSDADALAALAREEPIGVEPTDDGDRVSIAGMDVTDAIRAPDVAARVSEVSAHPGVRAEMVAAQRAVMSSGSWVSDGRDVGSAVVPGAELKVFLTASLEERARPTPTSRTTSRPAARRPSPRVRRGGPRPRRRAPPRRGRGSRRSRPSRRC